MKELINKTIKEIKRSKDSILLQFIDISGEIFTYEALADRCSESWFHHFTGVNSLLGHTVQFIEEIDELTVGGTKQDVDTIYFIKFETEIGYADLEMRNSSNGYYGGEIVLVSHKTELEIKVEDDF